MTANHTSTENYSGITGNFLWKILKKGAENRYWIALSILPLVLYILFLLFVVSHIENQVTKGNIAKQLDDVSERIQGILNQEVSYLSGIAVSQKLDSANLDEFRMAAELAWKERRSVYTIILNDREQQILNLRLGEKQKLPIWEPESLKRVWETGKPVVGDLVNGMFAVRVPVLRGGTVRYVLSEILSPRILSDLLHAEIAHKGWIAAVIDRRMTILARSEDADRYVGSSPTADIVQNIQAGRNGLEKMLTKDGVPSYGSVVPLGESGWHLVIAIPESVAEASYRPMRWVLLGGGGGMLALLVVFGLWMGWRNVGKLETAKENLSTDLANAHRESDEKSAFLAMISHELRTPLTGIIGISELLTNSYLDDQQQELVKRQKTAGKMLMTIVNDILDYSRIQANGIQLETIDFDILAVLEQSMALAKPLADAKGLALVIGEAPSMTRWLRGDPTRLQQVINNFLNNAVKFTARGEVRLSIEQETLGEDRILLRVSVQDTGIGIPTHQQARLFKRFNQANPSIAREYGGTGLGLSICKLLVELMGGTIGFESTPGKGSVFWFAVPFAKAAETVESATEPVAPAAAPETPKGRILLVEDDGVSQFLTRAILEKNGYTVVVAVDGLEAVDAVQRHAFDLVLMDMHLPMLDGIGATRAIRALGGDCARLPIWALSGSVLQQDIESCVSAGMDGHLAKPFMPRDLLSTVEGGLEKGRSPDPAAKPSPIAPDTQEAMISSIDQDKANELQAMFFEWLRGARAEFPAADAEPGALYEVAHRLIGSAGMFGHFPIVTAAQALCHACRSQDDALIAREHARLLAEVEKVCEAGNAAGLLPCVPPPR